MGNYSSRVSTFDFASRVAGIRAVIDNWSSENRDAVDREDDDVVPRLEALLDEALVATTVDNELVVPEGPVNGLVTALTDVENAIHSLDGVDYETVTVPSVAALTVSVEALSAQLFSWPARVDGVGWREAVTSAASTFRRSAGQQLVSLSTDIEHAKAEVENVRQQATVLSETATTQASTAMTTVQEQIKEFENEILTLRRQTGSINEQVAAAVARSDAAIGTQQQQFSDAQEARSKEFAQQLKQMLIDGDGQLVNSAADAEEKVEKIDALMQKTETLVEVFTAAGTANAYSREAKAQSEQANNWRYGAIAFSVLTAIAAGFVLIDRPEGTIPAWQLVVGKLAIGITLGAVAGYAARQSARHRRREERAKQLELNLETFGTLTSELNEGNLEDARAALVTTMLKQPDEFRASRQSKGSISDSQINLVQRIIDIARGGA